ncbi:MAG: ECF transporter S component [Chloroflexota bacterium]|nr:ECF transporter S component [Chloroflexota bacterium]
MSEETSGKINQKYYFSTRDLLIMAVLAALGGVASTYINTLSDAVNAILGFPGASQWAAGLHVIWIVLAMAITGKPGTGTLTGILKGAVELMSGNSHGIIILLVDLVAGLLVDFGFLIFRNKRNIWPYLVAGGLASASNLLVFQIFATLPSNILAVTAILVLFVVAFASGILFSGLIPSLIINTLAKANVIRIAPIQKERRNVGWIILASVLVIAILLAVFLKVSLAGPEQIPVNGDVSNVYGFPPDETTIETVTRQMEYKGVMTEYTGTPIQAIVDYAQPDPDADTLLIEATDGYAFLISFEELNANNNILLVQSGSGKNATFDVVGPKSSKAWVRGIARMTVIASECLTVMDQSGDAHLFDPDAWMLEMDSTQVALPEGSQKLQGVSVWKVVQAISPDNTPKSLLFSNQDNTLSLTWAEIDQNDSLRIFTVIGESSIGYALADMSGDVQLYPLTQIEIK